MTLKEYMSKYLDSLGDKNIKSLAKNGMNRAKVDWENLCGVCGRRQKPTILSSNIYLYVYIFALYLGLYSHPLR